MWNCFFLISICCFRWTNVEKFLWIVTWPNYFCQNSFWIRNFSRKNLGLWDFPQKFCSSDSTEKSRRNLDSLETLSNSEIFHQCNCGFTEQNRTFWKLHFYFWLTFASQNHTCLRKSRCGHVDGRSQVNFLFLWSWLRVHSSVRKSAWSLSGMRWAGWYVGTKVNTRISRP